MIDIIWTEHVDIDGQKKRMAHFARVANRCDLNAENVRNMQKLTMGYPKNVIICVFIQAT